MRVTEAYEYNCSFEFVVMSFIEGLSIHGLPSTTIRILRVEPHYFSPLANCLTLEACTVSTP